MNAVIMDNVVLGEECIVGALSFLKADEIFENRSLIVGNPAKKIKDVSDEMMAWKTEGTKLYQQLPKDMFASFKPCEPLRTIPKDYKLQSGDYKTWNETR
jgi:phenylacetic acid degradation protein